ncbi:DUF5714 domain-containing protein, partial [Dysosmobacter welbionis]
PGQIVQVDGIHPVRQARGVQRRQQRQQTGLLIGELCGQGDVRAHRGGQQLTAVDHRIVPSLRRRQLLHDLALGTQQPGAAVLDHRQGCTALRHIDQQSVRQLPPDADVLNVDVGQLLRDAAGGLVLVQQKEVVAQLDTAGLDHVLFGVPLSPRDLDGVHPEEQRQGHHHGRADHQHGQQLIEEAEVSPPAPPVGMSASGHVVSPTRFLSLPRAPRPPPEPAGPGPGLRSPGRCGRSGRHGSPP